MPLSRNYLILLKKLMRISETNNFFKISFTNESIHLETAFQVLNMNLRQPYRVEIES
jgi:hypothetical protein